MGSGVRALVVDDDRDAALSLSMLLRSGLNWDVRTAHDGHEALAVAESYQPQVAFLDILMPGMDGLELARRLRAMDRYKDIPIIAVSALDSAEIERDVRSAGFDFRLVKPVLIDTLARTVQHVWQSKAPRP